MLGLSGQPSVEERKRSKIGEVRTPWLKVLSGLSGDLRLELGRDYQPLGLLKNVYDRLPTKR
jgi:hypothetical protein